MVQPKQWRAASALHVFGLIGYLDENTAAVRILVLARNTLERSHRDFSPSLFPASNPFRFRSHSVQQRFWVWLIAFSRSERQLAIWQPHRPRPRQRTPIHTLDVMRRNRISKVAFFVCSAAELVTLAVISGMLVGVDANRDTETNMRALT